MSYQPPQQPPGGYDPNQARGEGGYDPNAANPPGPYQPPNQGGAYQPPNQGGYGAPPPGNYQPPNQGGYGTPPPTGPQGYYGGPPRPTGTSTAAIATLVVGIISILACCSPFGSGWLNVIFGVAAIVLYVVAQGQLRQGLQGRPLAVIGLVLGILGLLLGILVVILVVFFNSEGGTNFIQSLLTTATAIANATPAP